MGEDERILIRNFLHSARLPGKDVSALNPYIGYYKAAAIAQKAHREGITLRQAAIGSGEVTAEEFDRWGEPGPDGGGKLIDGFHTDGIDV